MFFTNQSRNILVLYAFLDTHYMLMTVELLSGAILCKCIKTEIKLLKPKSHTNVLEES